MGELSERTFQQRSLLLFALVVVLVLSIMFAVISLLIIHPPKKVKENYSGRTSVLFIVIDDLRPALGCYGDEVAITPNIDKLSSSSIIFQNAFAQQALGAPSRISFLTGRRPDSLHLYDDESYWRETADNFITLPEHFKNHGYETLSIGKVFPHENVTNGTDDFPNSWNRAPYWPFTQEFVHPTCRLKEI